MRKQLFAATLLLWGGLLILNPGQAQAQINPGFTPPKQTNGLIPSGLTPPTFPTGAKLPKGGGTAPTFPTANGAQEVIGQVEQLVGQFFGVFQAPDLDGLFGGVLNSVLGGSDMADGGLSGLLEGLVTFDQASDKAEEQVREAAMTHAQEQALGQPAQQTLKQEMETAAGLTDENLKLGEESQNLDVTQHILQNISMQLAQSAQVQNQQFQELQKGNVNDAIEHTLQAQAAKELSEQSTRGRRQSNGDANFSSKQACLGIMPGGSVLCQTPNNK